MAKEPRALTLSRINFKIPEKMHKPIMIILACILVIIILIYFIPERGTANCGTDEVCFLQKANNCAPAKFKSMIDTTEITYLSGDDCTFTKTITKLGEREPDEVKTLFLGLSMKCTYQKGLFDMLFIQKIDGNLDACTGPLRTVIEDLQKR